MNNKHPNTFYICRHAFLVLDPFSIHSNIERSSASCSNLRLFRCIHNIDLFSRGIRIHSSIDRLFGVHYDPILQTVFRWTRIVTFSGIFNNYSPQCR